MCFYKTNYKIKQLFSLLLTIILIFSLTSCNNLASGYFEAEPNILPFSSETLIADETEGAEYLKIHVIDVGQGLGVLFDYVNDDTHSFMLLDGGPADHTSNLITYLQKVGVRKLDTLFVTHYHADHINGSLAALKKFGVSNIYMPEYTVTSTRSIYTKWINSTSALTNIHSPSLSETFSLGNATVTILKPENGSYADENNYSIGVKVTFGNTSCICLGDLEMEGEYDLIDDCEHLEIDLSSQIYIVSHHGSSSSTSQLLMNNISKSDGEHFACISCGAGNDYGHPHQKTLDTLSDYGYKIWETDRQGDIVYTLDGNTVITNCEPLY